MSNYRLEQKRHFYCEFTERKNGNLHQEFCVTGSRETCTTLGQPFTATGNILQAGNDTDFFIIRNGQRVDFARRDFISFGIGATASQKEFVPSIQTPTFGEVSIDGLNLLFVSTAAAALSNSVAIPTDASFLTSSEVDTTLFSVSFNGASLRTDFVLDGAISEFSVTPTPGVPLASTVALFIAGFVGWFGASGRASGSKGRFCNEKRKIAS